MLKADDDGNGKIGIRADAGATVDEVCGTEETVLGVNGKVGS